MKTTKEIFSENLKLYRKELELTQADLAKAIGVSRAVISYWENGKKEPSITNLALICKYFNVDSDYFIGLKD